MLRTRSSPHLGFTLIELMVTIAVLAILVAMAAPSFRSILEAQRMRAAAFDLMADLTLARSEALKRGQILAPVTLTPVSGNWAAGWNITAGAEIIGTKNAVGSGVTINGPASVTFDRNGRVSSALAVTRFAMVNSNATRRRCISLDPSGRPKSYATECPAT